MKSTSSALYQNMSQRSLVYWLVLLQWVMSLGLQVMDPEVNQVFAKRTQQLKEDPLLLARQLLRDGFPKKASTALQAIDRSQEGLDLEALERLLGLIAREVGAHKEAANHFTTARTMGGDPVSLTLLIVQSLGESGDHRAALRELKEGPKSLWKDTVAWKLNISLTYQVWGAQQAYQVTEEAIKAFPKEAIFRQQRIQLLIELKLFQVALEMSEVDREALGTGAASYESIAVALMEADRVNDAVQLLERAVLLRDATMIGDGHGNQKGDTQNQDSSASARKQLARAYLALNRPLSAADTLLPIALTDPQTSLFAAELYRRAGKKEKALWMNRLVEDQVPKLRQRLTLLIQNQRYDEVVALEDRLKRLDLLSDEQVAYAFAYSLYRTGDLEEAERYITTRVQGDSFQRGLALLEAIGKCRMDVLNCE